MTYLRSVGRYMGIRPWYNPRVHWSTVQAPAACVKCTTAPSCWCHRLCDNCGRKIADWEAAVECDLRLLETVHDPVTPARPEWSIVPPETWSLAVSRLIPQGRAQLVRAGRDQETLLEALLEAQQILESIGILEASPAIWQSEWNREDDRWYRAAAGMAGEAIATASVEYELHLAVEHLAALIANGNLQRSEAHRYLRTVLAQLDDYTELVRRREAARTVSQVWLSLVQKELEVEEGKRALLEQDYAEKVP